MFGVLLLLGCPKDTPVVDSETVEPPSVVLTPVYPEEGDRCYDVDFLPDGRIIVSCPDLAGVTKGRLFVFDPTPIIGTVAQVLLADAPLQVYDDVDDYFGVRLSLRPDTGQLWLSSFDDESAAGRAYVIDLSELLEGEYAVQDVALLESSDNGAGGYYGISALWLDDHWVTSAIGSEDFPARLYSVDAGGVPTVFGPSSPCGGAATSFCARDLVSRDGELWYAANGGYVFRLAKGGTTPIAYEIDEGDLDSIAIEDVVGTTSEITRLSPMPNGSLFAGHIDPPRWYGEGGVAFTPGEVGDTPYAEAEGYGTTAAEGMTAANSVYRVVGIQIPDEDAEDEDVVGGFRVEWRTGGNAGTVQEFRLPIEGSYLCPLPVVAAQGARFVLVCEHETPIIVVGEVSG